MSIIRRREQMPCLLLTPDQGRRGCDTGLPVNDWLIPYRPELDNASMPHATVLKYQFQTLSLCPKERLRRLCRRAPPSGRCKNMKFVIPQCNNETVSVAQEYLDRAPESVLAIAAQRAPPDSTVSLKDWPDANVAALQVGTRAVL